MKFFLYIILTFCIILLIIITYGIFLPKTRTLTKQTTFKSSIQKVYEVVTNNESWQYRTSLDSLIIIERNCDFEVWDEYSKGFKIRFRTVKKTPYSFYAFKMQSKAFTGNWEAKFETTDKGQTLFTATETIHYRNLWYKVLGHIFMNLDKYMETYQSELRNKLEPATG